MTEAYVQLPPDGAGKKLRTLSVEKDGNEVHEEIVGLIDTSDSIINPAKEDGNLAYLTGLEIPKHDYILLSYTGDNLTGVVYKTGGSGGTTVATLTLAYTGVNLISVTKS